MKHPTAIRVKLRAPFFASIVLSFALAPDANVAAQAGVTLSGRLFNSLSGDPMAGPQYNSKSCGGRPPPLPTAHLSSTTCRPAAITCRSAPRATRPGARKSRVGGLRRACRCARWIPSFIITKWSPSAREHGVNSRRINPRRCWRARSWASSSRCRSARRSKTSRAWQLARFGPATARPVIRGLDGDRVLILQDGQRTGDLSTQSADHAVTINPAAAQRIEVVRGPATLLYGSNAIGGLVNVITDQIPTTPQQGASGNVTFDVGSAAKEAGAAADVRVGNGRFALHAGGGGRRSGDVDTPEGEVVNSQSRSGFGNIGLAWTEHRAISAAATATTTRSSASRSSRRASCSRRRGSTARVVRAGAPT